MAKPTISKAKRFNAKKTTPIVVEKPLPALGIDSIQYEKYVESMIDIFKVQSKSGKEERMIKYVLDYIDKNYPDAIIGRDLKGNVYITKGSAKTYPCVIAHLDTVHRIIDDDNYFVRRDRDVLFALNRSNYSRTGIGGDDKVGLWIALQSLAINKDIKLALFVEEEIGCQGSGDADLDFFKDVSFALQADRKGIDDFVNSIGGVTMYSNKFSEKIKNVLEYWQRDEVNGGLTDVKSLASQEVEICMANASCGYYRPHTENEYVVCREVISTLFLFRDIIDEVYIDGRQWIFKRILSQSRSWGYGYGDYDYGGYNYGLGYNKAKKKPKVQEEFDFAPMSEDGYWKKNKKGIWEWVNLREETEEPEIPSVKSCPTCGSLQDYSKDVEGYYCHTCEIYDFNIKK